jgi:hypothetical protein
LGRDEAPFFGVSRKEKREKRRRSAPFFAVLVADGVRRSFGLRQRRYVVSAEVIKGAGRRDVYVALEGAGSIRRRRPAGPS